MLEKQLWNKYTGIDESINSHRDLYDRYVASNSQKDHLFEPDVSKHLLINGLKPKYPENRRFALCISHDIDSFGPRTEYLLNLLKSGNSLKEKWNSGVDLINNSLRKKNIVGDNGIEKIHELNKKFKANSSFYFLALQPGELDYNYSLKKLKEVTQGIFENDGEIGLHGGFNAYMDLEKVKQEKKLLESCIGQEVYGYRGHFLKFSIPETWKILEKLKFHYDTTYGFANQIGFRNGMCHPFRPFCKQENRFIDIIELPLTIMDTTLTKYMELSLKEQIENCKKLIDTVEENRGVLSLLWHNDNLEGESLEAYEAILSYASSKNAWLPTSKEMVDYWKDEKYDSKQIEALHSLKNHG